MVAGVIARCRICEFQTAEPDVFSQHVADQHPGEPALALALLGPSESSSDAMRLSLRLERARNQINAIAQDMRDAPTLTHAGGLVPVWARQLLTIVQEFDA